MERAEYLKQKYHLEKHPEGGCFAEVYTAHFSHEDRSLMGSIYFLLEGEDISHFHQIDCDEIWYHHEGCGLKITMIIDGILSEVVIGSGEDQLAMAVIPKGAIFAAENLDKGSFCFMSCATTPKFTYDGFKLVPDKEIKHICPADYEKIKHLAFSEVMIG
jgi:predicted cupin superfamily sugar epimerase